MQKSFSIVDDDDDDIEDFEDKDILQKYAGLASQRKNIPELGDGSDSDEKNVVPRLLSNNDSDQSDDNISVPALNKTLAGPSTGRQTVLRSTRPLNKPGRMSSESDNSDLDEKKTKEKVISSEYDAKKYENLDVNEEIKEIFQYITKYIPQVMSLDQKFKPFVPEFLPAVGDIDAFLKIIPPLNLPNTDEPFDNDLQLGLTVLDEPAANQSDSALLHLQLRAESVNTVHDTNMIVKKVENLEKNGRVIEKWIKDISALHKSKSSPSVRYSEAMPDLDELMQEWPEEMEAELKNNNFPAPEGYSLDEYVEKVCETFQIPTKNKIHSLHLFFSLYAAVNSSQLFKNSQINSKNDEENVSSADQLVLD